MSGDESSARPRWRGITARTRLVATAVLLVLTGCTAPAEEAAPEPSTRAGAPAPPSADLELGRSDPVEDSLYPAVGDPGVDVLHYDLDLAWAPGPERLSGTATLTFRATADADEVRLDLGRPLRVRQVMLDARGAAYSRPGKDLVVAGDFGRDTRHELVVEYAGRPRPVPAPTTRSDFSTTGFTVTPTGEVWTMQEPYGAYSWYPVHDHPSDKALYDFEVTVPSPWTGVANGRLVSREEQGGLTTTRWHLDEPAASYLVTLAIGDYAHARDRSEGGVVIDHWYPRGLPSAREDLRVAAEALDWIEERLGPYPFSTLGFVVTDSQSAMETQTMVTLGNNDYVRSPDVILHELVHQWYGDQVSPRDWRDLWLNEGMTMYLQALWTADRVGVPVDRVLDPWARGDQALRDEYGPPGDYDPRQFGGSNVYHSPALMWHELAGRLGEDRFWAVARSWLTEHDNTSATREQLYAHWEAETGLELTSFFDAWIMGRTTPPRD